MRHQVTILYFLAYTNGLLYSYSVEPGLQHSLSMNEIQDLTKFFKKVIRE